MSCPTCKSNLYEKDRRELTNGVFISVRCSNPTCGYFNYKTIPLTSVKTTGSNDIK